MYAGSPPFFPACSHRSCLPLIMVLDPLSAIGLAGNIVQFVDFSYKLFSQTQEIYSSATGASKDTEDIFGITIHLRQLCEKLSSSTHISRSSGLYSHDNDSLRTLSRDSLAAADEMIAALNNIRSQGTQSKWSSFRLCLKTVWKQSKIDRMEKRLDRYRSQAILVLSAMIR
jgi:hypothetical protein